MPLEWQHLRPWNGTQHTAFEHLCCQLAACEASPIGSRFIRKGTPDGGVEGFWILPNQDEWAWQAKYFLAPPDNGQWGQLDDSVRTVLKTHPKLKKYFVCLPIDRPDARLPGQQSMLQRWNARVLKWDKWAEDAGMAVEFEYWGDHEIAMRLAREEHRGRSYFWFEREVFSQHWLNQKCEEARNSADERYTPKVNVDLALADNFAALGRTPAFYNWLDDLEKQHAEFHSAQRLLNSLPEGVSPTAGVAALHEAQTAWANVEQPPENPINWGAVEQCMRAASAEIDALEALLRDAARKWREQTPKDQGDHLNPWRDRFHDASRLAYGFGVLADDAESDAAKASNAVALCVAGEAGTGKTHLLCHIAHERLSVGAPTVLLMGEQFADADPLAGIPRLLGLTITFEEFLGALSAAGEAKGVRALLMIDALNESADRRRWKTRFMTLLTQVKRFPWVRLVVSVRSTYEGFVIPENADLHGMVTVKHYGFAEATYEATNRYFNAYGIQQPTIPTLNPEFNNPLFLKLFCMGLQKQGLHTIPAGLEGITAIFQFLISATNSRLAEVMDYDPREERVWRGVNTLADALASSAKRFIPVEEAKELLQRIHPTPSYELSLFRQLKSEGLLVENIYRDWDTDTAIDGVRFAYERLTDHLIAKQLLDQHLDTDQPKATFRRNGPLRKVLRGRRGYFRHLGVIEALSIQVPERIGRELIEVAPHLANEREVQRVFVQSLVHRNPEALKPRRFRNLFNRRVRWSDIHDEFLEVLITIASNPRHSLNAGYLHCWLMRKPMADRDAHWSIYLHHQYGNGQGVDRLLDWAWHPVDKSHIEDEAVRLAGTVLTWFFTSSHRFLRDRATKALVNLLTQRPRTMIQLLEQFQNVNDPYVTERLYAAAYGCAMRCDDSAALHTLAQRTFDLIFRDGNPPVHILTRDYARGIVELALARNLTVQGNLQLIVPPYGSTWVNNIPSKEDIEGFERTENWAQKDIVNSLTWEHMDFSNYVIGKSSGFEWTSRPLYGPYSQTRAEKREAFYRDLTSEQQRAFGQFSHALRKHQQSMRLKIFEDNDDDKEIDSESEKAVEKKYIQFIQTLDDQQRDSYLKEAAHHESHRDDSEYLFDIDAGKRWMVQRVFEMGWTAEKFGNFDRTVAYFDSGRAASKPERIGKKYQWIAYHEFLARVADNFEFRGDQFADSETQRLAQYDGPWQQHFFLRDIDPSWTTRGSQSRKVSCWWQPEQVLSWGDGLTGKEWLKSAEGVPAAPPLLQVRDVAGTEWLNLGASFTYKPAELRKGKSPISGRQAWIMIRGYLVKSDDLDAMFAWALKQRYMNRWMPEAIDSHAMFIGEFAWSPVLRDQYFVQEGIWRSIPAEKSPPSPHVFVPACDYTKPSNDFDCSIDKDRSIGARLPTPWLYERLGLHWKGGEGRFVNATGELVAQDPSVFQPGPMSLLVRRDALLSMLARENLALFWTVLGEKQVMDTSAGGWMEMNGAYKLTATGFEGNVRKQYRERP